MATTNVAVGSVVDPVTYPVDLGGFRTATALKIGYVRRPVLEIPVRRIWTGSAWSPAPVARVPVSSSVSNGRTNVTGVVKHVSANPIKRWQGEAAPALPLGAWSFSEGSGTSTADLSGNGHVLTVAGGGSGPVWRADGHTGGGATGYNGQRFEGFWGPDRTLSAWTVMCWVRVDAMPPGINGYRQFGYAWNGGNDHDLWMQFQANGTNDAYRFDAYMHNREIWTSFNYVPGVWYHYAVVYDGATFSIVVDAVQAVFTPNALSHQMNFGAAGSWCEVGSVQHGTWNPNNGVVDDLRTFDVALTPAQIGYFRTHPVAGAAAPHWETLWAPG